MVKTILLVFCALIPLTVHAVTPNINSYKTCGKLKQAAEAGEPDAQFVYGLELTQGKCTFLQLKHQSEGIEWWTKAANQGQADAMFLLGVAYLKGIGVNKDTATARQFIKSATARGSQEAINFLKLCQAQPEHSACN